MTIDWAQFTPMASLGGGALIGLAAAILVIGTRRIAGISGIFGEVLNGARDGLGWRLAFLAGLLAAPWVMPGLAGTTGEARFPVSWPLLLVAGLLTGYGTRIARGCTSGHGVCGIARMSPRSLAATACFMAAGFATVYAVRHLFAV